jgi:hypothetical protein
LAPKKLGVLDVSAAFTTSKRIDTWCPSNRHPQAFLSPGVPKTLNWYAS